MKTGIKFKAKPTAEQKTILAQWMGCAKTIWNAKCDEDRYLRTYASRYLPVKTYPKIDQSYSQYKDKELTPWLFQCPSQILRNSAVNWYNTYNKFKKGICGRPRHKKRNPHQGSVHLTSELFSLTQDNGLWFLEVGTPKFPVGKIFFTAHREFSKPKSIYIKRHYDRWTVSFCYEDKLSDQPERKEHFDYLKGCSAVELNSKVVGIDRGVKIPAQVGDTAYDFNHTEKKKLKGHERHLRQLQRKQARQVKGSNQQKKTQYRVARKKQQQANIRHDFCHKTSRKIIDSAHSVFIFEALKTKNMTRSAKGNSESHGKNVKAKSGLNRKILSIGWHKLQAFCEYKAERSGKAVFYINPKFTSQECASCGHTHPDNRTSQEQFRCIQCGHADNADSNAATVIKKRFIDLLLDSGTELSDKGVLKPKSDIGRGARRKSQTNTKVVRKAEKRQQKTVKRAA